MSPQSPARPEHSIRNTAETAIHGIVVDNSGEPVIGASVKIKEETSKHVVTDINGEFSLSDIAPESTIQVSCVGLSPREMPVSPDSTDYRIVMQPDNTALDEVVVVGYATQKKVDLTGAVASISAKSLEDRPITNATNALAGLAPGLTVTNSGGNTPGYE